MNRQQANLILTAAQAHALATADARVWAQVHTNLPHVTEIEERYRAYELKEQETYILLRNTIDEAVDK